MKRETAKGMRLPAAMLAGSVAMAAFANAAAADVTVVRGSGATASDSGRSVVLRGEAAPETLADDGATKVLVASPIAVAGSTIWLPTARGLTACWLRSTGYVGKQRIRCSEP